MNTNCPQCDGFSWIPDAVNLDANRSWYQQDWRLLIDPTVSWSPCPSCSQDDVAVERLHGDLAAIMMKRLNRDVNKWSHDGGWDIGVLDNIHAVYRWKSLACICRQIEPRRWMVLSDMGVTDDLTDSQCAELIKRAGAPELRIL